MEQPIGEKQPRLKPALALEADAYPKTRKFLIAVLQRLSAFLFRPEYTGLENLPAEGAYFLCGNHLSLFDVMLLHPIIPRLVNWVAKDSLFTVPIIGECVRRLGAIPINRGKADLSAIKTTLAQVKKGGIVGLFPQGTRVAPCDLNEKLPKPGVAALLARGHVPIVPFCIVGPYKLFRKTKIIIGAPFEFNVAPRTKADKELEKLLSLELMRVIYELEGSTYSPFVQFWLNKEHNAS